jgi:hypothetical protein
MSAAETTPVFSDGTPSIRMVLPHLLASDSVWTTELELELLEFAELCEDYSHECERASRSKHNSNNAFQVISMLCSGGAAVLPHLQNVSVSASSIIVSVVAASSLIANVVQSVFSFEKGAIVETTASIQLREMSKSARLEVTKSVPLRWLDPFAKMLEYEEKFSEVIHKISPKIVDNDVKTKIKQARRARMKIRRGSR